MHGSSRFNEFASPKLSIAQVVEDLTVKVVRSSDLFIIMQNSLPQIAAVLLLVLLLPTQSSVGQEYGQEAQKKTVKTPTLSKPVPATIATEFSQSAIFNDRRPRTTMSHDHWTSSVVSHGPGSVKLWISAAVRPDSETITSYLLCL